MMSQHSRQTRRNDALPSWSVVCLLMLLLSVVDAFVVVVAPPHSTKQSTTLSMAAATPPPPAAPTTPVVEKTVLQSTTSTTASSTTSSNLPSQKELAAKAATTSTTTTTSPTTTKSTKTAAIGITDLYYDGKVPKTEADEYVVITNNNAATQDVSGYILYVATTGTQGATFTFPKGSTVAAQKSVRIYTNEIHKDTGGYSFQSGKAIWNNKGGLAVLKDAQGKKIGEYKYDGSK